MKNYHVVVPKPSAKRLEKDRTLIIKEIGAFHSYEHKFPIEESDSYVFFDFEFKKFDPLEERLDTDVHYECFVRYANSTRSRIEEIKVKPCSDVPEVRKHIENVYKCHPDLSKILQSFDKQFSVRIHNEVFIDFQGWNCPDFDEDCAGWDGIERRCACGNRRVAWEWDDEQLWAEAW